MWMELLEIFRSGDPMKLVADEFMKMLAITHEMANIVQPTIFDHSLSLEGRKQIYDLDVQVNKLERSIRKRIISHLTLHHSHVPYCLLLMSLVKDAERIGDYVKNVADLSELGGGEVPSGELRDELTDQVNTIMRLFEATPQVLAKQDREGANELIRIGRNAGKRSDKLVFEVARSADMNAAQLTSLVLLTRFYKRIGAHLVNILSSVVMPLHKVDYFDEDYLDRPPVDSSDPEA